MLNDVYLIACSLGVLISAVLMSWTYLNQRKHNIINQVYQMINMFLESIEFNTEEIGLKFNASDAYIIKTPRNITVQKCKGTRYRDYSGNHLIRIIAGDFTNLEEVRKLEDTHSVFEPNNNILLKFLDKKDDYCKAYLYISRRFRSRVFEFVKRINSITSIINISKIDKSTKKHLMIYLGAAIPVYLKFLFFVFYYYENNKELQKIIKNPYFEILKKDTFVNIFSDEEQLSKMYKEIKNYK